MTIFAICWGGWVHYYMRSAGGAVLAVFNIRALTFPVSLVVAAFPFIRI
jgi:hypothetical protein